jgi:hypothetical protein
VGSASSGARALGHAARTATITPTLVELTGAGADLIARAPTDALAVERRLLQRLGIPERDELARGLRRRLLDLEPGGNHEAGGPNPVAES